MNYRLNLIVLYVTVVFSSAVAQLPENDLILFDIQKINQNLQIDNPRHITSFNLNNYNNQPSFFNAQTIYFSAIAGEKQQTDVFAIDLLRKTYWQVTDTPDGEYSPTLMPTKRSFSVIVQEAVTNTQRLWQFPVDQSSLGKDIFPGITGVGYHCWINRENAALFIVGSPNQLVIANSTTQEKKVVLEDVGRGMRANKRGLLYFIHKLSDSNWILKRYDPNNNSITTIVQTPGMTEDFELMSDETIIMANGSDLFSFNPDFSSEWKKIASLSDYNIDKVTRLAIQGQKLVVVTNKD